MCYNTKSISDFTRKHPNNYSQLMHMSLSNYLSLINHVVMINNVNNTALQEASDDVGLTIDSFLKKNRKGIMLVNVYLSSFDSLASNREATYGNYIALLLYSHAMYVIKLNAAIKESLDYSNLVESMSSNGKMIITLLQSAGNNAILIDKSLKMWKHYMNDTIRYVKTKLSVNVVQLHSFHIANHMMQLLG